MEKIKIGFIGCGGISYGHLRTLKTLKEVEICGVFDPNKENVEKFIKEAGESIKVYDSDKQLIEEGNFDGVVICSPHTFHFPQIKLALENNLNVLVEKPAVINYRQAVQVKKLLEEKRKVFVVGYQRHYMENFVGAKKLIEEGKIGKILFLSGYLAQAWIRIIKNTGRLWRFDPKFSGGGQLTDSGSHFVAMIFYLTDLSPLKVFSFIDYLNMKVDINSAFIVKFKEGPIGSFGILGIDPGFREALIIWGEKGVIKISASGENSYLHLNDEKEPKEIEKVLYDVKNPAEDFIKCIREKVQPKTPFKVVEKVALLSDKIYRSFKKYGLNP